MQSILAQFACIKALRAPIKMQDRTCEEYAVTHPFNLVNLADGSDTWMGDSGLMGVFAPCCK